MAYLDETVWGPITPKWLGCYELELHDIVETAIACRYDRVIDVGCAEGYYAVGFAWRMPETEVITFDIDPIARRQTRRLAAMAGVSTTIFRSEEFGRTVCFSLEGQDKRR
jgi:predicted O-methyltransferase YrrM